MVYVKRSLFLLLLFFFATSITSKSNTNFEDELYVATFETEILVKATRIFKHTEEEINLLARLINAEAGGEPYEGKLGVGQVVINRARINSRTITKVITRKNQFCGVKTKRFYESPPQECIDAATEVIYGVKVLPDNTYYFLNPKYASKSWMKKIKRKFYKSINNHNFYSI